MIGIYKIENKVNGKVYIGQSVDIEDRWAHHKAKLRHNRHENAHLQSAWNQYGEDNFTFETLTECKRNELNDKEIDWISRYDSCNRKKGYNLTLGGDGTHIIHEVLQFTLSGEYIAEYANGIIASEETGINAGTIYGCCNKKYKHAGKYIWLFKDDYKDSDSLKWYLTDQKLQTVLQYDLYGNIINTFTCCSEAWKTLGFNPIQCLLHDRKSINGFIFKYINDPLEINEEYCKQVRISVEKLKSKTVYQIDKDNNIINKYKSIREAGRAGYSSPLVSACCKGLRDNYKGYIWMFEEEYDELYSSILLE